MPLSHHFFKVGSERWHDKFMSIGRNAGNGGNEALLEEWIL